MIDETGVEEGARPREGKMLFNAIEIYFFRQRFNGWITRFMLFSKLF